MACQGLRVILDTSVFVFWYNRHDNYIEIMKSLRKEGLKIVLCESLRQEYLRHLYGRSIGTNYWLLQRQLQELSDEGILEYANPKENNPVKIHVDDQHVLDCAFTDDCFVHLVVTDNGLHFESNTMSYDLPLIISTNDFIEKLNLHTRCSDAKRICQKIKQFGTKARYS